MISRFFRSRIFLFFTILFIVGFIAGYDYAVITSRELPEKPVKAPVIIPYDDMTPAVSEETTDAGELGGTVN